ncbi:MAG: serine/threonine-protein kinase [Coleofasciculus sp. C1-SOL-03]|uniref:pentapeptide repeat-containing protein n=1 Tax=Coleofasciculus sp. C1-SOL-03 TaxID=3069522 RepID=UPI0032F272D4
MGVNRVSNYPNFEQQGYQILRELGSNNPGGRVTYLAKPKTTNQFVVIKQFQFAKSSSDWAGYNSIYQEIKLLKHLNHPSIPRYLDYFETSTGLCLVQEYKKAPSLAQPRHFTPQEVQQIAIAILNVLVYLQQQNPPLIHRDIKPENILVDRCQQFRVYLVDFGLARIASSDVAVSSMVKGTLGFMPPEQMFNRQLTIASDLYSLGMTLICLLTRTSSTQIANLIDERFQLNFKSLLPTLNPRFVQWLEKMTASNLKHRYPSAAMALTALKSIGSVEKSSIRDRLVHVPKTAALIPVLGIVAVGLFFVTSSKLLEREATTGSEVTAPNRQVQPSQAALNQLFNTGDCPKCDLRNAKLWNTSFTGANLAGANLAGANLKGANLARVNLEGANLSHSYLRETNLEGANLKAVNLTSASLVSANLRNANLAEADLANADLEDTRLEQANLESTNLQNTNLVQSRLTFANLLKANLQNADLSRANLSNANLSAANLTDSNLKEAILRATQINQATQFNQKWRLVWQIVNQGGAGLNLVGTDLAEAHLAGVNLAGANLSDANLNHANLSGANLQGTNLEGANLSSANLRNAKLTDIKLQGANLARAILSELNLAYVDLEGNDLTGAGMTSTNLKGANLKGTELVTAYMKDANLEGADLRNANLTGTNLTFANLQDADFRNTNLSGANLIGANLQGAIIPDGTKCADANQRPRCWTMTP